MLRTESDALGEQILKIGSLESGSQSLDLNIQCLDLNIQGPDLQGLDVRFQCLDLNTRVLITCSQFSCSVFSERPW